jgi:hypothetical protein
MIILGCCALFIGFIFLLSVLSCTRRLSFPRTYALEAVPLSGLKDSEIAGLGQWSRDLEAHGFRRAGEFTLRINHVSGGNIQQIEQSRVWLSADGRTWAWARHESMFDHSNTGFVRSFLSLAFHSRTAERVTFCTHNRALDEDYERHPKNRVLHLAGIQEAGKLLRAHEARLAEASDRTAWEPPDFPTYAREDWEAKTRWLEENGYLKAEGETLRATPKLGWAVTLYSCNPLKVEEGRKGAVVLKLLACAAVIGVAAVLVRRQVPVERLEVALCGLSVLWGMMGSIVFPRLSHLSWFFVVLPAYLYLDFRERYQGWSWVYGYLLAVGIATGVERLRYAGAGRRLDARPSEPSLSPAGRRFLIVGLLVGVLLSAAAHVAFRAPMPTTFGPGLMKCALLLSALGLVVTSGVWVILAMFPERRKWKRYPLIRGCGWCGLIVMVGLLTAIYFENVDQERSIQRAATIQSALEEYRKEKRGYPDVLQELVPKYLSIIPAPRVGWSEVRFEYRNESEKQRPSYRLTYRASPGELVFRPGQAD